MKSVVKMMGVAFAALLTLGACSKDKVNYVDGPDSSKDNIGYLLVGGMEASILEDTENVENSSATRAGEIDINTFDVVITNKDGQEMASFKYGERPSEPIELVGGVYKITMSSAQMQGASGRLLYMVARRRL